MAKMKLYNYDNLLLHPKLINDEQKLEKRFNTVVIQKNYTGAKRGAQSEYYIVATPELSEFVKHQQLGVKPRYVDWTKGEYTVRLQ